MVEQQQKFLRAIVRIQSYGRPVDFTKPFWVADRTKTVGTGVFVEPPSSVQPGYLYIITCFHCVDTADSVTVVLPNIGLSEHPAQVVSIIPFYDLAIVALPDPDGSLRNQTQTLPLGSSANLTMGQKLTSVGYPMGGTTLKASDGAFAGFHASLQHTVSISPGNSGGPLMNESGEIVGINTIGILPPNEANLGFAVPIEYYTLVKSAAFAPLPDGDPAPDRVIQMPMFGIEYAPITRTHVHAVGASACLSENSMGGVQIVTVLKGSPMHAAGVMPDDILVEFDGIPISNTIGEMNVTWNCQKVWLQDVFARSVEPRSYTVRLWKASTQTCVSLAVQPRIFAPGALRTLFPPYEPVPYMAVIGLVIMPLIANHAIYPATMTAYMCKNINELAQPHLIVTHVFNGTIAQFQGSIVEGDELSHVNNVEVKSLDDLRVALPKPVTTTTGYSVLTFRTCTGKTMIVNTLDALNTEEKAVTEKLYTPDSTFMTALTTARTQKNA